MNKLVAVLVLTAGACLHAFAQTNIDRVEYFFDSDPGVGNGTALAIAVGPVQDIAASINTSGLSVGFHTLVVRARHQSGSWGIQDSRVVYVMSQTVGATATVDAIEYYIDTDPGPGNGIPVALTAATSLNLFPSLATASLSAGFHILHVRARDADGNWGIPEIRPFYVVPGGVATLASIVQLEYFFDTEPGYGAGTALTVTAGGQINLAALIGSASLSTGFHTISIRAKDDAGEWGMAETRTFYVDAFSQVSALEYFIDTDPGDGAATSVPVTTSGQLDVNVSIPTGSLPGGVHTLGVRAARTDGSWGNTSTVSFSVKDTQTISFGALAGATFGDAPIVLSGTSSASLPLTYASSDPTVATITGNTLTIVGAGTTQITASQPGDAAYAMAPDVTQAFVVNKASQSITFGPLPPKSAGDAPFTITASTTSGLPVTFTSSNLSVATVSGNTLTLVGAGTTNISAIQSGNGNYNPAPDVVQSLVVAAATNPPALAGQSGSAFFVSAPIVITNTITITDADNVLSTATVSITSGFAAAEDQLLFTSQNGITGNYNAATGVLTMTGTASVVNYQAALSSVQYNNVSSTPGTTDRVVSFQVNDGTTSSNAVTVSITINKPPAIDAPEKETQAGGNIVLVLDEILSDPDNNLDLTTLKITSARGASVSISGNVVTVNYSSVPEYNGIDELTITVCDLGGKCRTQTINVEVGADVEVFNGISANGDEVNRYLRIRFLPTGSRVTVFSRWGDVVYENDDYDTNDPAKRFEGQGTNGAELTAGTYFYVIALPDGTKRTGYLQLKR